MKAIMNSPPSAKINDSSLLADNQCTCDINFDKHKTEDVCLTQALDDVLDDMAPVSCDNTVISTEQSYRSFNDDVDRSYDKDLNVDSSDPFQGGRGSDDSFEQQVTPPVRFTDMPVSGIQVVPLGPPPNQEHPHPQLEHARSQQKHQPSQLEHLNSRLENPTSQLEHPQSQLEHAHSPLEHPTSQLEHPASQLEHPSSQLEHPQSQLEHPQSLLEHAHSQLKHPHSQVEHPASQHNKYNPHRLLAISEEIPSQPSSSWTSPAQEALCVKTKSDSDDIPLTSSSTYTTNSIGVQYSPPTTPFAITNRPPPAQQRRHKQQSIIQTLRQPSSQLFSQAGNNAEIGPLPPVYPRSTVPHSTAPHSSHHATSTTTKKNKDTKRLMTAETVPLPDVSLSKISLYDNVQYDMSAIKTKKGGIQHFHF